MFIVDNMMQNAPVAAPSAVPVSMNAELGSTQMSSSVPQPQHAPSQLPPQSMIQPQHLQTPMTSKEASF